MIAKILVSFFIFWKCRIGLKGAGLLLRICASFMKGLQHFPLRLNEGQIIHIDIRDYSGISWLLFKEDSMSCQETALVSAIKSLSNNTSVIWDVGSNCGIVSYLIAKETQYGSIHFFEPNDFVYDIAVDALRPFKRVFGHNFALSNSNSGQELTVPKNDTACATLNASRTAREGIKKSIRCRVGDHLIESKEIPAPDIVKIDVEGHELEVFDGMSKCIDKFSPIILFEHISLTDEEIEKATPENYELYSITKDAGELKKGFDRSLSHNSVLIPLKISGD